MPNPNARGSTAGPFSVIKWGTAWVIVRERDDGARIVSSMPFRTRREAQEWADHWNARSALRGSGEGR